MGVLPVPAETIWSDFSFDLQDVTVFREGQHIATYKGLLDKGFIFFKPDVDIQCDDTLSFDGQKVKVQRIANETYNGNIELISVHY